MAASLPRLERSLTVIPPKFDLNEIKSPLPHPNEPIIKNSKRPYARKSKLSTSSNETNGSEPVFHYQAPEVVRRSMEREEQDAESASSKIPVADVPIKRRTKKVKETDAHPKEVKPKKPRAATRKKKATIEGEDIPALVPDDITEQQLDLALGKILDNLY